MFSLCSNSITDSITLNIWKAILVLLVVMRLSLIPRGKRLKLSSLLWETREKWVDFTGWVVEWWPVAESLDLITLKFIFGNCFCSCTSQNNYDYSCFWVNVFFYLSSIPAAYDLMLDISDSAQLQNMNGFNNNNVWFFITCCFGNNLLIQVIASPKT